MKIRLSADDLIYPYFVISGQGRKEEIDSFPGVFRFSVGRLLKDLSEAKKLGINKILLFGVPDEKDAGGTGAYKYDNIVSAAARAIKKEFPGITVMTDVCLCAYTTHGHCGILKGPRGPIDNKKTLESLSKIALSHAEAGADYVAPSAMAKRQILAIRRALDKAGRGRTRIMGYSAKFASSFYGPFRAAADSAPKFGDRRAYQLDFTRPDAAMRKIADDIREGADIVMVKPALGYLDLIKEAAAKFKKPVAAYNVSGEYAMVKYGVSAGLFDEKKVVLEILHSIKRAGADYIITYHAKDAARWLKE